MKEIICLQEAIRLKTRLLIEGCNISKNLQFPQSVYTKQVHLYAHSHEISDGSLPEDIMFLSELGETVARIRYSSSSHLSLNYIDGNYCLVDKLKDEIIKVQFLTAPQGLSKIVENNQTLSSVCSFLGHDLLGVVPSNYCFYFKDKKECRFCELWPTFKEKVAFKKPLKRASMIANAVAIALKHNPHINHLAFTTGNVNNYDYTVRYFCEFGALLNEVLIQYQIGDNLATLMPPDDFELLSVLKKSGFNKVYFPLEVFEPDLFEIICPGKAKYGYQKLLAALEQAIEVFGTGNVYSNLIYGIQSLNNNLDSNSYSPIMETERCYHASKELLKIGVIPVFTVYHYAGYNDIGPIALDSDACYDFFVEHGKLLADHPVLASCESVIFGRNSLSNTLYNDTFCLANKENIDGILDTAIASI